MCVCGNKERCATSQQKGVTGVQKEVTVLDPNVGHRQLGPRLQGGGEGGNPRELDSVAGGHPVGEFQFEHPVGRVFELRVLWICDVRNAANLRISWIWQGHLENDGRLDRVALGRRLDGLQQSIGTDR